MSEVRLIDANAYAAEMKQRQDACKEIMNSAREDDNWELYECMGAKFSIFVEAKLTLDAMPTVDAVPVVRCAECKNWLECLIRTDDDGERYSRCCLNGVAVGESFYCADGERREHEQIHKG